MSVDARSGPVEGPVSADAIVELSLSECQRDRMHIRGVREREPGQGDDLRADLNRPAGRRIQLSLLPVLRSFGSGSVAGMPDSPSSSSCSDRGGVDDGVSSGGSASERTWLP